MELFTEIEFSVTEFDKIDSVIKTLTKEGWKMIHSKEFFTKSKKLIAKKYKFSRIIK